MHHIQTRPYTYYAGITAAGKQVLIGWIKDVIAVLIFDSAGALQEALREPVDADLSRGLGPVVESRVLEQIGRLKAILGFRENPIVIAPFSIGDLGIVLRQLPDYFEEYLRFPDRYSDDAEWYESRIREWVADGKSVLAWGSNYYLTREGFSF